MTSIDAPAKAQYEPGEFVLGMLGGKLERCGDGVCDYRENWRACSDCSPRCGDGELAEDEAGSCRIDELLMKWSSDGEPVTPKDQVRDGLCDTDEDVEINPYDCSPVQIVFNQRTCGDGVCDPHENSDVCAADCGPGCGDRCCSEGELDRGSPGYCERDCPYGATIGDERDGGKCSPPDCGDGKIQPGEACDDGNYFDEDGCPSRGGKCKDQFNCDWCTRERCDDRDEAEADPACVAMHCARECLEKEDCGPDECQGGEACGMCQAPAACGDGFRQVGKEECDPPGSDDGEYACGATCMWLPAAECGNGVVEFGEECDDGDADSTDDCVDCVAAFCGDGQLRAGVEACDDGNFDDDDECLSSQGQCALAVCGDGVVWSGVEVCDDGNDVDTDACVRVDGECRAAMCGDGFVHFSVEGCDDGNAVDTDKCSNDCVAPRVVFLLSSPGLDGDLGGIAGADELCQQAGQAIQRTGSFKAWLTGTDASTAPAERFGSDDFSGWYQDTKGGGVAHGWEDLTQPKSGDPPDYLRRAIRFDAVGAPVAGDVNVWSNTTVAGEQLSPVDHCESWTTASGGKFGSYGLSSINDNLEPLGESWTAFNKVACNVSQSLYCFQTAP